MAEVFPRRIVARRDFRVGIWIWLALGIAAVGTALYFRQRDLGWLAVWPLALAFFLWFFRERTFELQLGDSSLALSDGRSIAYEHIERVRTLGDSAKNPGAFPIFVRHTGGHFTIPAKLDTPSSDLLAWLQQKAPPYVLQINSRLHEYLTAQESLYGNRIAIYVGETKQPEVKHWGLAKAVVFASLVCAVAAFAAYATGAGSDGSMIIGVVSAIVFIVGAIGTFLSYSRSQPRQIESAGLVVSPAGLAMVQGDLAGELRWEEIRSAKLSKGMVAVGGSQQVQGACIRLTVAGATIQIADIYHEPISHIYASIERLRSV